MNLLIKLFTLHDITYNQIEIRLFDMLERLSDVFQKLVLVRIL